MTLGIAAWQSARMASPIRSQSTLYPSCCVAVLAALSRRARRPARVAEPTGLGPTEGTRGDLATAAAEHGRPRQGWAADVYAALATLELPATPQNVYAVLAVSPSRKSGSAPTPPCPDSRRLHGRRSTAAPRRPAFPKLAVTPRSRCPRRTDAATPNASTRSKTRAPTRRHFEDFVGVVPLGKTFFAAATRIRHRTGPMR